MLSAKAKRDLIVMMASKKDADRLEALMATDGPIDLDMLKRLEIALGSKKLAAQLKAKIENPANPISHELEKGIAIAMASAKTGKELEDEANIDD
jgi:hypothetical protein